MLDGYLLTPVGGGLGIWAMFGPPSAHLNRLQVDLEQVQNHLHQCVLRLFAQVCAMSAHLKKLHFYRVQGKNSFWRVGRGCGLWKMRQSLCR